MSEPEQNSEAAEQETTTGSSRAGLVWEVLVFQLKLAADGLRDVLLVPVSIVAGVLGLLIGGDRPDRYFRSLLGFGRQTERWINLFGSVSDAKTSDILFNDVREKVMATVNSNPQLQRASEEINKALDLVNDQYKSK